MKKNLCLLGCLATVLFGINSVNALSFNENGTVINKTGYTLSAEQYNKLKSEEWTDEDIDKMPKNMVEGIVAGHFDFGSQTKNIVIITTYDDLGNPVDVKQLEVSEAEGKKVLANDNYLILSDGKLHNTATEITPMASHHWYHQTTYKKLTISYFKDYDNGGHL